MFPLNFLRFNKRPPGKRPPPRNFIDLFWSYANSRLEAMFEDGTTLPVSGEGNASFSNSTSTDGDETPGSGGAAWAGTASGYESSAFKASISGDIAYGLFVSGDATSAVGSYIGLSSGTAIGHRAILTGLSAIGFSATVSGGFSKAVTLFQTNSSGSLIEMTGASSVLHFKITGAGAVTLSAASKTSFLAALGIPTYADLTAANAALNAGDIYFDTALGVLRSATA